MASVVTPLLVKYPASHSQLHIKHAMLEIYWLYFSQAEEGHSNNSQTFSYYFIGYAISFYTLHIAIDHGPSAEFKPNSRIAQGFIIISTAFPKYILSLIATCKHYS